MSLHIFIAWAGLFRCDASRLEVLKSPVRRTKEPGCSMCRRSKTGARTQETEMHNVPLEQVGEDCFFFFFF